MVGRLGGGVPWLVVVFTLGGCSATGMLSYPVSRVVRQNPSEEKTMPPIVHANQDNANHQMIYTVQPGDNIYVIAWAFERDDQELIKLNHLPPPYELRPGDKIWLQTPLQHKQGDVARSLVVSDEKFKEEGEMTAGKGELPSSDVVLRSKAPLTVETRTKPTKSLLEAGIGSQNAVLVQNDQDSTHKVTVAVSDTLSKSRRAYWAWPTHGKVNKRFGQTNLQKGIELGGEYGQEVYAACDGMVVYSGNSINYFDNLIIIKHDNQLMSAYGYNAKNLVSVGQKVSRGQKIAVMGHHHNHPALYFEIRKRGKPIDPCDILPHSRQP